MILALFVVAFFFRAVAGTPPVPHITTDPLLPQAYRTVPPGKYPCSVDIHVSETGKVTDVTPTKCDQDAFWPLATAILQWTFDPATENGVPVAAVLPYTSVFEVKTLLPRKNVVGFVGGAVSAGGAGLGGVEGRIHLGEQLSVTAGVDIDQDVVVSTLSKVWTPVFRADVALSSKRQHFEHRGIYGFTMGGFADPYGAAGGYAAFRGELMTGVPGLSFGGDAGIAAMFTNPPTYEDVGVWPKAGISPFYPWLRASLIWYAPIPRDRFVVIPRAQDPLVFEPVPPPPEEVADLDGTAFPGIPAIHWSEIEPAIGEVTPTGPGFDKYPPGSYDCFVRVAVDEKGLPAQTRIERCPKAGRDDALANIANWRWPERPGKGLVQAVFPAPIFVEHDDADMVRFESIRLLADGQAKSLPRFAKTSQVFVSKRVAPDWGVTLPTRTCAVDVDLDASGTMLKTTWINGDIEVKGRVDEALAQWRFYPVAVDGELTPVRVRLVLCDE